MAEHKFTAEQWMNRKDRSCEPRFSFEDFTGMFGMVEIESGVADICNKAKREHCLLRDVRFSRRDIVSDDDAFRELLHYGWLIGRGGEYRLRAEAVNRVRKRHPHL